VIIFQPYELLVRLLRTLPHISVALFAVVQRVVGYRAMLGARKIICAIE